MVVAKKMMLNVACYVLSCVVLVGLQSAETRAQSNNVSFELCGKTDFKVCADGEQQLVCIRIVIPTGHLPIKEFELQWDKMDATTKQIIPANKIPDPLTFTYNMKAFINSCDFEKEVSIKLVTRNQDNTEENLTRDLTFINKPRISFSPSRTLVCVNQRVDLSNQSCPSTGNTYTWNFGDGTTSKSINTDKLYATTGTYTITLSATNVCGVGTPATRKVVVSEAAIPKIGPDSAGRSIKVGIDSVLICLNAGGVVRLDGIGSLNATDYDWDIVPPVEYLDKTTENSVNPKVRFVKPGTYTISLRVNNACNVWSERIKCAHIVADLPILTLDNPGNQCADFRYKPSPFDKTARYTINGKPLPASGDTLLKVTATNYDVVVEGTLNNLCGEQPQHITFTMGNAQAIQVLSPRQDTTLCAGTADLPLITNQANAQWDASPYVIQRGGKYFFMPKDTGSYTLRVRQGVGKCQRDTTVKIRVNGISVRVNDMAICRDQSFLKLLGTPAGGQWRTITNCPNCIQSDTLLVGNLPKGLTSLLLEYRITSGCSATATATVTIGQPLASFSVTAGCSNKAAQLKNLSVGASLFQWLVNGKPISSEREPALQLPAGQVQLTLVAWSGSCTATTSQEVIITPVPIETKFTPSVLTGCSPLPVTFTLSGNAQAGVTYQWNFGNASTSTTFQPTQQVFDNVGRQPKIYTITFTGTTTCGSFSQTASITVRPRTKAEIGVDSTTLRCPPATLTFSNRSTGNLGNSLWEFGDLSQSLSTSATVVKHEYRAPLNRELYFVRLTAYSDCGNDTDSIPVTVLPVSVTALFTISRSQICVGETVQFTDATTPKPARVIWEINGEQLEGPIITYNKFTKPQTAYLIRQTVYPQCGGYATYEQSIQTDTIPKGDFQLPSVACPDQPVSFTNTSKSTLSFRWNFGDNTPIDSTYFSPTHTYKKGGASYSITMTVVSFPLGCTNATTHTIPIRNKAKPDFITLSNGIVCSDTLVTFENKSEQTTEWKWFANGRLISTAQQPQVRLQQGHYDIKLWASNNGMCPDSVEKQDVVRVDTCLVQVANVFTPNGDNIGDFFNLYGNNLIKIRQLLVFSRSGAQVYEGIDVAPNTQTDGWDGRHHDRPLPPDNYVYEAIVEFMGGTVKKHHGVVTLLR